MASENKVILIGNITRDLELRYTPDGQAVTVFSIAINRRYKDQSGQVQEKTDFIPIEVWGKQAENCKQYLAKGRSVYIDGRLQNDSWQAPDGTKRSKMKVVARNVQFLGGGGKGQAPGAKEDNWTQESAKPMETATTGENLDEEIPF